MIQLCMLFLLHLFIPNLVKEYLSQKISQTITNWSTNRTRFVLFNMKKHFMLIVKCQNQISEIAKIEISFPYSSKKFCSCGTNQQF